MSSRKVHVYQGVYCSKDRQVDTLAFVACSLEPLSEDLVSMLCDNFEELEKEERALYSFHPARHPRDPIRHAQHSYKHDSRTLLQRTRNTEVWEQYFAQKVSEEKKKQARSRAERFPLVKVERVGSKPMKSIPSYVTSVFSNPENVDFESPDSSLIKVYYESHARTTSSD